jgi:hypothetical protein
MPERFLASIAGQMMGLWWPRIQTLEAAKDDQLRLTITLLQVFVLTAMPN